MSFDPGDVALCVADDVPADPVGAPVVAPVVQTSPFTFPDFGSLLAALAAEDRHHVYTRGRNPTVEELERKLARLERGEACIAFGSGMGAVSAVLLGLLEAGDHVLFVNQVYGPTLQLAAHLERFGVRHDLVLETDPESVADRITPRTRLLWLESPGTMLFRTLDIRALAGLAAGRGALTCVDNSWATPLLQKPLERGADLVVHSASKYLGGHGDAMGGAVVARDEGLVRQIFYRAYLLNGALLPPHEAWLLLRGLRTLPVRLARQGEDALRVARFLRDHPAVGRVHHPALAPDAAAGPDAQLRGYAGLFSFELRHPSFDAVRACIDGLRRFRIGVSWGGVESLVISPERGDDGDVLRAQGLPPGLIRLSVGLEGAEALIEDLDRALRGLP